jgi:hypothetical protein
MEIEDRNETILEIKKVLTKKGLMLQLEQKSQVMDIGVQRFFNKFEVLHKKGLPGLLVLNEKLITLPDYNQKLKTWQRKIQILQGYREASLGKLSWRHYSLT